MQNASVPRPKCPADRLSAEKMWARNGRGPSPKWTVEEEKVGGRGGGLWAGEDVKFGGSRHH